MNMKGVGAMAMAVEILSPPKLCNWVRLSFYLMQSHDMRFQSGLTLTLPNP